MNGYKKKMKINEKKKVVLKKIIFYKISKN